MAKVLITGGAGFIGLNLGRRFAREGFEVHLLDNFKRGVKDEDLNAFLAHSKAIVLDKDLLLDGDLKQLDLDYSHVLHFAAKLGVSQVLNQPYETLRDNMAMTMNILGWAQKLKGLKRFVFASTSEVYAGTLSSFSMSFPTPETTPLTVSPISHPRTSYMLSKIYGEALTTQSGLPFTIIRPHNIYGPRMGLSHVIPELLKKVVEAKVDGEVPVYSVNHQRTFCFIEDAAEMIFRATSMPGGLNQTFNVGVESPEVTIGQLAQVVTDVVGKKVKLIPQPEAPGSPVRRCPSMKEMLEKCEYQSQTSLVDGIRQTYNWYSHHVFVPGGVSAT